jgi:hypothetical protein
MDPVSVLIGLVLGFVLERFAFAPRRRLRNHLIRRLRGY